ncbi:hypothetical protein NHX12_004115 [Muraenolepis orangiensis]|uniref:START domain-containing protein n=1 Tax=Muraenolepis orangiensis TaxID=630683 RepID=A0A9Q0DTU6_9TELE|nr:hypothetical protein NHX12_004115 [Muraenolepis orangiensis]
MEEMREEQEEEEEKEEEEEENPTLVKMSQIVMLCHSNHRQELSVGQLLKWMDSTACLSASIDDIYFDHTISVGQVVNIKAKVNRAFNTSMETGGGESVMHTPPSSPNALTLEPRGQVEHSLAAERRRMRMVHDDIIKDLLSDRSFQQGEHVGDRLRLKSIVNNAFKTSMEVGVHAEAYRGGGPNRHINSAFMIFEVLDDLGNPRTLPRIRPEPLEGSRRFQEAIARKKVRLDRKYIISCKQSEVPLSVPWNPSNQVYLSYNNVSALKTLAARSSWRLTSEKDQVCLYTLEQQCSLSFRVEAELEVSALRAFMLLGELRDRASWDSHYMECDLIRSVDNDDFLYRVVTPSVGHAPGSPTTQEAGVLQDFILLASKRRPCGPGDPYVVALRSVSLPTHPPSPTHHRGEVLCAGFTILATKENSSLISYYNQTSPEVLPYISTDIAGLSSSFYRNFCSCRRYLTQNCLGPEGPPGAEGGGEEVLMVQELHPGAPPRSSTQEDHPGAPSKSSTQEDHPGAPPRRTTQEDHPGAPPRRTTQEDHPGAPPRRTTQELHPGGPPRRTTQELHPGGPPRGTTQELHPGGPPRSSTQEDHPGGPPRSSTQEDHPGAPPRRTTQELHPGGPPRRTTQELHPG